MVAGLLAPEDDRSLLLSCFREYLEYDDIRYHTMQAAADTVARVTDQHLEVSGSSQPSRWQGGGLWLWGSGWVPAGAPQLLGECLHAAVSREPALPRAPHLQLLREA